MNEKPNKDHYPKVVNGHWYVYDPCKGGFVSTGIETTYLAYILGIVCGMVLREWISRM